MRLNLTSGSLFTGLAIIGTGAAVMLPDQKWIGGFIILVGVLALVFDVKLERSHIAIGTASSLSKRLHGMAGQIMMLVGALIFIAGAISTFWPTVHHRPVAPQQDRANLPTKPSEPIQPVKNSTSSALASIAPPPQEEPKIAWQFISAGNRNAAHLLFGTASGTSGFWVVRYRITGTNNSGQQLTNINSYVVPKNTGRKIQMQMEMNSNEWRDTDKIYGIPPDLTFSLAARIYGSYRDEKVATAEEYLDKYGGFTFVFECNELPPFSHTFDYREVSEMLLEAKRRVDEDNKPRPKILPKD